MDLDRILGVSTTLTDRSWNSRLSHPCQPTPYEALEALNGLIRPGEHIADVGCGTGRTVFWLAHTLKCRVTGIELDDRRCAQIEENLRRCTGKFPATAGRIALIHAAAQSVDYDVLAPDALYFFNPFPSQVLRGVLRRVENLPRLRLICYYPDDSWISLLSDEGWLRSETVDLRDALGRDERERIDVFIRETNA